MRRLLLSASPFFDIAYFIAVPNDNAHQLFRAATCVFLFFFLFVTSLFSSFILVGLLTPHLYPMMLINPSALRLVLLLSQSIPWLLLGV
jgi:hypothetical protein